MNNISLRQSHAALDMRSRQAKARKIEAILSTKLKLTDARVLDVGAGSGIIANHMSQCVGPDGQVVAVDVMDQRQVQNGFRFVQVTDTRLPFEDASFDVVISNHVMEHVGNHHAQLTHLTEINRVLKENGMCYIAVPNRWSIIEPHFRLPLLSWLPPALRSTYLRLVGRGRFYDCNPLSRAELIHLIHQSGLIADEATLEAIKVMLIVENVSSLMKFLLKYSDIVTLPFMGIIPTLIFVGQKKIVSEAKEVYS